MVVVALLVAAVVDRADRRAAQATTARAEAALLTSFARVGAVALRPAAQAARARPRGVRADDGGADGAGRARLGGDGVHRRRPLPAARRGRCRRRDRRGRAPRGHRADAHRTPSAALFATVSGQALLALRNRRMAAEASDAQRRADAAGLRTALLSAVGHDLRTPLTAIKAAAGSLRDPTLRMSTTDRQELLATVEESADRLTGLVDNLLDSSRLAAGGGHPDHRAGRSRRDRRRRAGGRPRRRGPGRRRGRRGPARRARRRRARRAGRRQPRRQRPAPRRRGHGRRARQRLRRPRRAARRRRRAGRAAQAARPTVRPVPAPRGPQRRAPGSASACTSRAASPRRWAARSTPRTPPAAA